MSDFASLLSQLDQSAKQPTIGNNSRHQREEKDSRKRPRKNDNAHNNSTLQNDTKKRSRRTSNSNSKPHDASQLTIKLGFVCIGAQKAGTSWLHEMLRQVPGLGLPEQKEVHFWDWHRRKGLSWYSRQFPRSPTPLVYGEITPCYMTLSENDISEIHALFPKLRIVFIARDLVQRAWSALTMELRNNVQGMQAGQFHTNSSTTLDSITQNRMETESDPDRQTNEYFMNRLEHSTHTQRSDYAGGLRRWLKYFDPEQILIVSYDEISKDPKGLMEEVLKHIGLKGELVNELSMQELEKRFNVATKPRPIRPSLRKQMEAYLQPLAKEFNGMLKELGYEWTLEEYD